MNVEELPEIERTALRLLLSGDDATRNILRAQLSYVTSVQRTETGAGVYLDFEIQSGATPLENKGGFPIDSSVFATSKTCDEIGFLLFVNDGLIDFVEAYTHSDIYPSYADCNFTLEQSDNVNS